MEGTSTLSRAWLRRLLWCALLGSVAAGTALTSERGETYVIVERPSALVIYDRYQQVLGPSERLALGKFVPFRILNDHDRLGDGITPCASVEVSGVPFYLLRDDADRLAGEHAAGGVRWLRNATPLGDSVDILRSLRIQEPGSGPERALPPGERLHRIFRSGERTYVLRRQGPSLYGWVVLQERDKDRIWSIPVTRPESAAVLTPNLASGIRGRVDEANRVLAALFAYFNSRYHSTRSAPQWTMQTNADGLVCLLEGPGAAPTSGESTRALAREIENIVIGSRLRVDATAGRITVHPG